MTISPFARGVGMLQDAVVRCFSRPLPEPVARSIVADIMRLVAAADAEALADLTEAQVLAMLHAAKAARRARTLASGRRA